MSKHCGKLNTEVFEVRDSEFSIECLIDMVNDYIKEYNIAREDIQEYRTEHWVDKAEDGTNMYNFRAILTWWTDLDKVCCGACSETERNSETNEVAN